MNIKKALIPIAGLGTRLMPLTGAVPKAMFPFVNSNDKIKSVLHVICDEAISAGVESIGLILSPWQVKIIDAYLDTVHKDNSEGLSCRFEYIIQNSARGFGDAVMQGRDFVENESFLLLLGDHVHVNHFDKPTCALQVANAFCSTDAEAMIGVQTVSKDELSKVGVSSGAKIGQNLYRCKHFIEKPDLPSARAKLITDGLSVDTFLAHCGIYIFSPEIFYCIEQVNDIAQKEGNEVELADAQKLLLKKYPDKYYLYRISGRAYDVGTPKGYADAQTVFRSSMLNLKGF